MATANIRPAAGEYASFYAGYVSHVKGDGNIVDILARQIDDTVALFHLFGDEHADLRYESSKWTVREVLGHMIDAERIFAYRALRFSRSDQAPLPGFEQDDFVREGPYGHCALSGLIDEFALVRQTTLCLLRNLGPEAWSRQGVASGHPMTVRASAYVIAGHELHHVAILRERYLPTANRPGA